MTSTRSRSSQFSLADGWILLLIWLLSAAILIARLWLDVSPPAWDQGAHLSSAMSHWQVLQHPQWGSGEWWRELWLQSASKRGPVTYLLTVPIFILFGPGADQGVYVNLLFTAILIGSTYAIGRRIFSPAVGLWAAGLSLLSPVLIDLQKDYLLDFPMTAVVVFMFMGMTYFWLADKSLSRWLTTVLWGVGMGLTLMTRTSGLLFVIPPIGWMLGASLWQRHWLRLGQVILGGVIGLLTLWPWFSTSWLTIISTTLESTVYGGIYADAPQANTLAGWLFYPERLPQMLTWPLFCLAAIAWILIAIQVLISRNQPQGSFRLIKLQPNNWGNRKGWIWLLVILLGIYVLFALATHKRLRFIIPYLPIFWIVLSQGIVTIQNRWWHFLRWGAVGTALVLTITQLSLYQSYARMRDGKNPAWPNEAVINEIVEASPFLETTLGLVVNTAQINPFNMDFYGAVANFHVSGRQLSSSPRTVIQDSQALDWYLTKTEDQGAYDTIEEGQQKLRETVETSDVLSLQKSWTMPDGSELRLHHRQAPPITVSRLASGEQQGVSFEKVDVASQVAQGQSSPITYYLRGSGAALQPGLLLLTWQPEDASKASLAQESQWISDHAIGLGYLKTNLERVTEQSDFEVVEQLSVTPPENLPEGIYHLNAEYLNRDTGEHYVMSENAAQVEVVALGSQAEQDSFQDLLTYLHIELAPNVPNGELDPIFNEIGRINQYDPEQDYLLQAERAMTYRLSQTPNNLDWLYTLALAQVLQQKAPEATATFKTLTEVAPENPHHWAYLGFVHLYRWQPRKANIALSEAEKLQPDLPNLKLLQTVNAVMGLNIPKAVRLLRSGV
ncbi:MAG: glycosyltransferase family 39 protein [Cyanobacteria bacterium P01_A01_bin.123]